MFILKLVVHKLGIFRLLKIISDINDTILLQSDLDLLYDWCTNSLIELNLKKWKSINFSRCEIRRTVYYINGTVIHSLISFIIMGSSV